LLIKGNGKNDIMVYYRKGGSMEISFEFVNKTTEDVAKYQAVMLSLVEETVSLLKIDEDIELSLIIVDNQEIHQINQTYRGIDRPTDVISFALEDTTEIMIEGMPRMLGDIFISIDKIKEQAKEYQHSFQREFAFLFVHGLLHLLGYDHNDTKEQELMFEKQRQILEAKEIYR